MAYDVDDTGLLDRLRAIVGADFVVTGRAAAPFHTDIYEQGPAPLAVVAPGDVEALRAVVRMAVQRGIAIHPRGGGASYTGGYLPTAAASILLDLRRLDRIVEINQADAYVTVEAGVTWAVLKSALDPLGLRTPFFGPFSGLAATIGGSVSQNSISHGSGAHGVSAQSVLSLDVVTASGEILRTGSAARGSAPFARFHGPDLCGLFTGDCGALGVKARITLPLLAHKAAFGCASFAFEDLAEFAGATRRLAMEGLDSEHFGIDRALSQGQIGRQQSAGAVSRMTRDILASAPSVWEGLATLIRLGLAGTRRLTAAQFMMHVIVEGVGEPEVAAKLKRLRAIMAPGREIPGTIPTVVRALPFAPLANVLGPGGERWVPLHGVLQHSKVQPFHQALNAIYARHAEAMKRLGVWTGAMFQAVNASGFLYEVALYWPGAWNDYHAGALPSETLADLPRHDENPAASELVADLKGEIAVLYDDFGAAHFQLGRLYPYAERLEPLPLALIRAIKRELDPNNLMNPGVLGL